MEGLFGRPKKVGGNRGAGGGQISRPHSECDLNELDEQEMRIDQLSESQLANSFEEMLVSFSFLGFRSQVKRGPISDDTMSVCLSVCAPVSTT